MNKNELLSQSIEKNIFTADSDIDTFIFTLSDLHIGLGNLEYIEELVKFIKKIPHAMIVIGGDLIDNPTRNSKGSVIECYAPPQEQIKLAVELLKPIKDKIVCIIGSGNHEQRTEKDCYISIPQIIATMLEIPEKYVKEFAIGYFNIGKYSYIYANLHKHRKQLDYYDYMNADVLVLEHTHEYNVIEKCQLFHNKYTKKTSVRSKYIINNGSALAMPSYAKLAGYKMQPIGTYVIELLAKERRIIPWRDIDLIMALENGYKAYGVIKER